MKARLQLDGRRFNVGTMSAVLEVTTSKAIEFAVFNCLGWSWYRLNGCVHLVVLPSE